MPKLIKQLEIILSNTNHIPEKSAELVVLIEQSSAGAWRFFCTPALKMEHLNADQSEAINSCTIRLSENVFEEILSGRISQQEAHSQGRLVVIKGSLEKILEANIIIDSLCELCQAVLPNLNVPD